MRPVNTPADTEDNRAIVLMPRLISVRLDTGGRNPYFYSGLASRCYRVDKIVRGHGFWSLIGLE